MPTQKAMLNLNVRLDHVLITTYVVIDGDYNLPAMNLVDGPH
jgi:hypothetical protein